MRHYEKHKEILNQAERSDYLVILISALTPIYRAANAFSNLTIAHLPSGAMHLFTAAPLLQNYLRQLDSDKFVQAEQLQKEIDDVLALLPYDIKQHYKNSCRLKDELERLEKQLEKYDLTPAAEEAITTQAKIDNALRALLIAERALETWDEKIIPLNKKEDELHDLKKNIREQEQGLQATLKNLPISAISNSLLLLSLGFGLFTGGLPQLIQMGLDLGVYYGLSTLVQELASRLSFEAYQNDPDNFNDLLWARTMAVAKTTANLVASPVSKKLTNYIASVVEKFSGVERIAFDELSSGKNNSHTRDFLDRQPTLIVQPGKPVQIVDAEGQTILYETHSNTIARSQWHFETNHENVDVYVSARNMPYVAVSPKTPEAHFPEALSKVPASLSNIAFLSAVYAVFGPIAVFGITVLSQTTTAMAESIPDHLQKAVDKYYVDQLQLSFLKEVSKKQPVAASNVIATFNALSNFTHFVTETFPELTSDQSAYLISAANAVANARLLNYQQIAEKELKLRKAEGLLTSAELPQSIIDDLSEKTLYPLTLVTATATAGMQEAPKFYWKTLSLLNGLSQVNADQSLAQLGKSYADQVFQLGYINNIFSSLKAYAKTNSASAEKNLLAALNTQLNELYGPGSALSTEAQEIKKIAMDYVLNNAPAIVKAVNAFNQVQKFVNSGIHYLENAFSGNLTTLACDIIGSNDCNTLMHFENVLSSDIMMPFEALGKFVAHLNSRVSNLLNTTLLQNLSPAQKIAYQKTLQDVSIDFTFASNIAMLLGSSKNAAKILALGKVSVNLLATLSSVMKMGTVMSDIGKFAAKIMPVLAIVNGIFSIFSIFGGGESATEQYDKAILKELNILIQQVQTIIKIEIDISKEIGQLYSTMQSDFIDVLKNLKVIFDAILQNEAITQKLFLKVQSLIRQLSIQVFNAARDTLDQSFEDALTISDLIARSEDASEFPERNISLRNAQIRFHQRGNVDSKKLTSLRNVGMEGVSKLSTQQNMVEYAEANNLGLFAPEYSIQFFQAFFESITQKATAAVANALMWLETVNPSLRNYFGYDSKDFLSMSSTTISAFIQTGTELIQFGLDVRNSDALWDKLIGDYINVLKKFLSNAAAIMQNAWQAYASSDQNIAVTYIVPLKNAMQALTQRVLSFQYNGQYDQTPLSEIIKWNLIGWSNCPTTDTTIANIVNAMVYTNGGIRGYLNSVVNSILPFDPLTAFFNIFSGSFNVKYPMIAFDVDGLLPPADLTNSITLDPVVMQGILEGKIKKIDFSFKLTAPTLTFTGIYTLKDESQVTFFAGSFPFPAANAGTMTNLPSFVNPHCSSFTIPACSDPVADSCVATCDTDTEPFASLDSLKSPNEGYRSIVGMLIFPQDISLPLAVCLLPTAENVGNYVKVANILYNAVLMNAWETQYKNTSIANTAQWADQKAYLITLIEKQQKIISGNFFNSIFNNPTNPAYTPLSQALEALGAAYNLIVGYLHFGFADYTKGSHAAHENFMTVPVNPWRSNGTAFEDQHGVQCNAIPGNRTTMQSNYSVIVRDKALNIDWSPLNNANAKIGLQLGDETLVTLDYSIHINAPFHTNVSEMQPHRFLAITVDRNNTEVGRIEFNSTKNEMVLRAFVESQDAQQGIRITNATILQKNTTIPANVTSWSDINTPAQNTTDFSENSVTFFNTHESNPIGFSKVRTNQTHGVLASNLYFIWQADSGVSRDARFHKKPYNMTVGIDLGEQENVTGFAIGGHGHFHSKTPHYTRIMVTSEKIVCVTCRDRFDDEGGFVLENTLLNNNFVADFSSIALSISKSNAPDGRQSLSVLPIRIVGFAESILPEPMSAEHWESQFSLQNIVSTPNGLTVTSAPHTYAQLTSKNEMVLRGREIRMKWKAQNQNNANVVLQLSGQPVATFTSTNPDEWMYTRVVIFNNNVTVTTAAGNYDLNPGAANVVKIQTPATISIGTISWIIDAAAVDASFTLGACMIQDAVNTILGQKGAGLMNKIDIINAILSTVHSPQAIADLMQKLETHIRELREMLGFARMQPEEADPDISNAMKLLMKAQQMALVNGIAKATLPSYDNFPKGQLPAPPVDFSKTMSSSKSDRSVSNFVSDSASKSDKSESNFFSDSASKRSKSGSNLVSVSGSESSAASASKSERRSFSATKNSDEAHSNNVKIYLVVIGCSLAAGIGITGIILCMRRRRLNQQQKTLVDDQELGLLGTGSGEPLLNHNSVPVIYTMPGNL